MKRNATVAVFFLLLIGIWQTAFSLGLAADYVFPSPMDVLRRMRELHQDGYLWPSIRATLLRMVTAYMAAGGIGVTLGLAMGMNSLVRDCLRSLVLGLQILPSVAWVPIALLIFGLSDMAIYFVIIMSSTGGIASAVADGVAHIPPVYLRAARTLGTPRWAMAHRVILPAALPAIVSGLKLGWTLGWHGAVSAELIRSSVGLGYLLYFGRELNDAAQVVGIMLCTILIGLVLDKMVFGAVEHRIRKAWGLLAEN